MADHPIPKDRKRDTFLAKSLLGAVVVVGVLSVAAWSVYFRFVVGKHPLSPFVMPAAPAGEAKVTLADRIDGSNLWLRHREWRVPQVIADRAQDQRLRERLACRLRFVEDLDEKRRFEAKNRDWIEIWQEGRVVCRVYFGAFVGFPASGGEWLLYCGCRELYPQLRREAETFSTGSEADAESGTTKDDPP